MLSVYKYLSIMCCIVLVLLLCATSVAGKKFEINYEVLRGRSHNKYGKYDNWPVDLLKKEEAQPHIAPYIVSIQQFTPNGLVHFCAGSIINEHWILTAAHCLESKTIIENSVIVAGCHDIHDENNLNVQHRTIDYFVRHELYLGGISPYDIALIYTKNPLEFSRTVQPATLPKKDDLPVGRATLYGWGNKSTTRIPSYPSRLQQISMPIVDLSLCENVLGPMGLSLHFTNLCTGPLTGGTGICTADSGGPLVQHDIANGIDNLIGIVSWGKMPCGQINSPSVYVRVSAFIDWINKTLSTSKIS